MPDGTKEVPSHYLHKEMEQLVRTDPATWEFIRHSVLDGVWYWDLENPDNEWMSPEFWRLFGYDPATRKHDPKEWQSLIFEEDLQLSLSNFRAHCADPNVPYDQLVRYRHANGSTVWVRCRGLAIRDKNGKPIRMLGAHTEVTAANAARAESAALAAANRELREVAYALSHDLKSPASRLQMLLSEFLETHGGDFTEEGALLFGLMENTIEKMQSLIDELLAYSMLVREMRNFTALPLDQPCHAAVRRLSSTIRKRDAVIEIGDLPAIHGDASQIETMFHALLSNAITYVPEGCRPQIVVTGQADGDVAQVSIRDNGIGIDPQDHDRIFGMFQRLHREDEIPGHGLGLALCRRIATNHDARIGVTSTPGQGSTFTITFPRMRHEP